MTPRDRQSGFTLVELVIAIGVMGVLLPALAMAFHVTSQTVGATTDRIGSSAGTTLSAASFGPDVQSALSVSTTAAAACPVPTGATVLLTAHRTDGTATWFRTATTVGRQACIDAGAGAVASTTIVELDPAATAPALSCDPACASGTPSSVTLSFTPKEGTQVVLRGSRRNT